MIYEERGGTYHRVLGTEVVNYECANDCTWHVEQALRPIWVSNLIDGERPWCLLDDDVPTEHHGQRIGIVGDATRVCKSLVNESYC